MSTTRQPDAPSEGAPDKATLLNRGLGTGSIVFMVVAAAAPLSATCAVIPLVLALSGNPTAPLYFIAAAVILCLFAVGFTLMSRYVKNAGAFYSYVQAGLGKVTGAGAASLALVSYALLLVSLYALFGAVAAAAVETYLGLSLSWWVLSLLGIGVIAALGYRDIEVSAKVLGVALVLEVLVVVVVDVAIVTGGDASLSAAPLDPTRMFDGAPGLGLMFAFFAFFGFEATAVFRSEATEPERTIPRATYIAVITIGVFYAITSWAMTVGAGTEDASALAGADPANFMQGLAGSYVGSVMSDVVQILLVTSLFACALSFHNVVARYQFNLANGGLLPTPLGAVHPRHRAPSVSSLVATAVSAAVLAALAVGGLDPVVEIYTWFSGAATLGLIALMALTSVSVIVFHRRGQGRDPVWNAVVAPVLSLVGLCVVLYLVIDNFDLIVAGRTAATVICLALVGCFVAGAAVALVTRSSRPDAYARMLED